MNWRPSKAGIAVVFVVGVGMGIGPAELDYPIWTIPLIGLLGAAGAAVAVALLG
jgi:hypothetical protein